jgi:hypothetical protein
MRNVGERMAVNDAVERPNGIEGMGETCFRG